jgi:hypothetical protein
VSVALRDPKRYQIVRQKSNRQPDYLMWNVAPRTPYFVVECKGSQSRRAATIQQLQRGLEQVPSLVFRQGPREVMTLVVATLMQKTGTTAYILDPPDDTEDSDDRGKDELLPKPRERSVWKIEEPEKFERDTWNLRLAQILNWAGQFRSANHRLPDDAAFSRRADSGLENRILIKKEIDGIPYAGQIRPLFPELDRNELRLFMGVQEDLLEAARHDPQSASQIALNAKNMSRTDAGVPEKEGAALRSVSSNGLCMEIQNLL